MAIERPVKLFDFGKVQVAPAYEIDRQFDQHRRSIEAVIRQLSKVVRADGKLNNDTLTPESFPKEILEKIQAAALSDALCAQEAMAAMLREAKSRQAAVEAALQAMRGLIEKNLRDNGATRRLGEEVQVSHARVTAAVADTEARARDAESDAFNAENEVLRQAAVAEDWANVSIAWAEHMPDTIPPNILATNSITGEHWSSRWWAHRAGEFVGGFLNGFYMGPFPAPPNQWPNGDPLLVGGLYFNTTDNTMYVWTGSNWIPFSTPQKAATSTLYYEGFAGQTDFALTSTDLLGNNINALDPLAGIDVSLNGVRLTPSSATFVGDYEVDVPNSTIVLMQTVTDMSIVGVDVLLPNEDLAPAVVLVEKLMPFPVDGVTTDFPLLAAGGVTVAAADTTQLVITVDGVTQEPGRDYLLDTTGTIVSFLNAPDADSNVFTVFFANSLVGAGGQIIVVHDATLTGSGTTLDPLSVVDLYVNADGDTMTGGLTINADLYVRDHAASPALPTNAEHLTNKEYVDSRIAGTLILIGTLNASTGQVTYAIASGIPNGPLPPAGAGNVNNYVIVAVPGVPPIGPPETQIICQVGDWWVSDGNQWLYLPIGATSMIARNVALIPQAFGAGNVQDALETAEAVTDALDGRVTINEGDIFDLQGRVTVNEGDILNLDGRVTVNEGDILDLQGRVTTNEGDIADLDGRVTVNESDIADLQTEVQGKVDRTGDTMTGLLTLAVNPTAAMDAATKIYVDTVATGARVIIGVIDASTGLCVYAAPTGIPNGPLVDASSVPAGSDVICVVSGTIPPGVGPPETWGMVMAVSDVLISNGTTWLLVHVPRAPITASGVQVIPSVFGSNNVQDALAQAERQDMPPGGVVGQVLGKTGAADYASQWIDPPPTGIQDDSIYMKQIGNVQPDQIRNPSMGFSQGLGSPGVSPGQWLYITYNGSNANNTYILQECFNFGPQPGRVVQSRWVRALIGAGPSWTAWQEVAMGGAGNFVAKSGDTMSGRLQIAVAGVSETTLQPLEIVGGGMQITSQTGGSFRYVNRGNNQGGLTFVTGGVPQYTDWLIFNFNNNALSINNLNGNGITIINGTVTVTSDLSANAGSFSGPVTAATPPTNNAHLTNKGYVDQLFSAAPILIGVIDAGSGNCQFANGTVGPVPIPTGSRHYIICTNPGTVPGLGFVMRLGDQLYDGLPGGVPGWILIAVGTGGIATTADQVALIPNVAGTNNVQAGMQVLNTNKVEINGTSLMTADLRTADNFGLQLWGNNRLWKQLGNNNINFDMTAGPLFFRFNTVEKFRFNQTGGFEFRHGGIKQITFINAGTGQNTWWMNTGNANDDDFNIAARTNGGTSYNYLTINRQSGVVTVPYGFAYLNTTGALLVNMAPNTEGIRLRKNNTTANTTTPRLKFEASDGRAMGWIFGMQLGGNGYYGTWPSQMRCTVGLGGFGEQTCWTSVAYGGGWVGLRVEGDLSARSYFNNSDASLKSNIAPLDISYAAKLFDSIIPKQFHWKPVKIRTKLGGEMPGVDDDPSSINLGFIANDIEKVAPKLVQKDDKGKSSYDLTAMVAILWAKVKELEERLAAKEHG